MSSTFVGDGAALAGKARGKSRGTSPAAATMARRDACPVARPARHSHDGADGVSPQEQDAQTSREEPERARRVMANVRSAGPRVVELWRVAMGRGHEGEACGSDAARPR